MNMLKAVAITSFSSRVTGNLLIDEVSSIAQAMVHQLIIAAINPMDPSSADIISSLADIPVIPGPLDTPLTVMTSPSHKLEVSLPDITPHSAFVSWHNIEMKTKLSALTIPDQFYYHQKQLQMQLHQEYTPESSSMDRMNIPTLHWVPLEAIIKGEYLDYMIDQRIQSLVIQASRSSMESSKNIDVALEEQVEGIFPRNLSANEIKLYGAPPTPVPSPSTAALMNKIQDEGIVVVDISSASPSRGNDLTIQPKRREYAHGVGTRVRLPRSANTLSQQFYEQVFD